MLQKWHCVLIRDRYPSVEEGNTRKKSKKKGLVSAWYEDDDYENDCRERNNVKEERWDDSHCVFVSSIRSLCRLARNPVEIRINTSRISTSESLTFLAAIDSP